MVRASAAAPRADDIRLGILYMVASVFLFSFQNAIGKWLAQSYPIPMLVFFRSAVALLPSYLLVMRAGGVRVMRTNRLGAQFGRAAIWGGSNVASFFAYHLLPLADAIALTFAAPLFLTALSWPMLKERVSRERWIAVSVGFVGVLVMARPSGAGNALGMVCALFCAGCNAFGTLAVRGLTRTEFDGLDRVLHGVVHDPRRVAGAAVLLGDARPGRSRAVLLDRVDRRHLAILDDAGAVYYAPAAAVSPFNYMALIWGSVIGFLVWGEVPTTAIPVGAAIVTLTGLYLLAPRRLSPHPAPAPRPAR